MSDFMEPYQGYDMAGFIMKQGFVLPDGAGAVKSVTSVKDVAVIVTEWAVWVAVPASGIGFSLSRVWWL